MVPALHDGGGGHQRQPGILLEIGNGRDPAVAHGRLHLVQALGHIVLQGPGVGDVGIYALLEGQTPAAAQIVPLPVPGPVGALAPVLLHILAVDQHPVGGALIEPGEVPAQHQKVRAHSQGQGHVVIVDDSAVGADGHVDAGFLEILVPGRRHLDKGRGLAPADALCFPGDADGAAADAHLHEVRPGLGQEPEPVPIDHVARAHLDGIAVALPDEGQGLLLPTGVALGGVDAQHIRTGFHQGGNPGFIVLGIDARAHHEPLLTVQQLAGVLLVALIVLAEHEVQKPPIDADDRQGVELVVPDDVVGLLEAGALGGGNKLLEGGHELGHRGGGIHAADPVVPAGDDAQQPALVGAVGGDGHGGVPVPGLQVQHVLEGGVRGQVGVAGDKARLIALHPGHHGGLVLHGLGAVDEAQPSLPGQGHRQGVVGHGLHDGGHHGNGQAEGTLLLPFAELHQRGAEGYVGGDAVGRGIAGHQQILAEGVGGLGVIVGHGKHTPFPVFFCRETNWLLTMDYTADRRSLSRRRGANFLKFFRHPPVNILFLTQGCDIVEAFPHQRREEAPI